MTTDVVRGMALVNGFTELNTLELVGGPTLMTKGDGIRVTDSRGTEYVDAVSGMWSAALGFGHPELVEAAVSQLRTLPNYHGSADKATPAIVELAERLRDLAPGRAERVLLVNGGSEANDTQLKLHRYYRDHRRETSRRGVVVHDRGYHGATLAAGSISNVGPSGTSFGHEDRHVVRLQSPCRYWNGQAGETEDAFVSRLVTQFEQSVVEAGPDNVGIVLFEPVLGAGGIVVPPADYYPRMVAVARSYGIRVVADEVITGFGRTGALWGSETFGISPDTTSCAKALTGGYIPAGAVMVDAEMNEALMAQSRRHGIFAHGFTTGGHPVPAAVALRVLDVLQRDQLVEGVASIAAPVAQSFAELRRLPLVGDVRGVGLLWGVEFEGDDPAATAYKVVRAAARDGLIVRGIDATVCLCLPLIVTLTDVVDVVSRLRNAIVDVGRSA